MGKGISFPHGEKKRFNRLLHHQKPASAGFLLPHRFSHQNNVFHAPQKVCNASLHRWRGLDGLVNLHKVIDHKVEAHCMHVVFQLAAKRIGQASETTHRIYSVR